MVVWACRGGILPPGYFARIISPAFCNPRYHPGDGCMEKRGQPHKYQKPSVLANGWEW
jgi:hypothetical protein